MRPTREQIEEVERAMLRVAPDERAMAAWDAIVPMVLEAAASVCDREMEAAKSAYEMVTTYMAKLSLVGSVAKAWSCGQLIRDMANEGEDDSDEDDN